MSLQPLNPADALNLQAFLESASGQTVLARMRAERPDFGSAETIEAAALRSREAKGWENCLSTLWLLATAREEIKEEAPYIGPLDEK